MTEVGIRIVGLVNGGTTLVDGQWLVEYDPTRPGVDPLGRPMLAHIVCSPDPGRAVRFASAAAAHRLWTLTSGRTRPDGQPDRPLTAFNVAIEPLDGEG